MSASAQAFEEEFCPNCGDWVSSLNPDTGFCKDCSVAYIRRVEQFLERHADHIEHYMGQGLSFTQAIKSVRVDIRPICLSCGGVINRGAANANFCRVTPICRRYSRKYVYLYQDKGFTKAQALAIIIAELT